MIPVAFSRGFLSGPLRQPGDHAFENQTAVRATQNRFAGAFGVRHEAGHVPALVANPCDVRDRAVRIGGIGGLALRIDVLP